mmetsp:Transcript_58860/g.137037  ORF Transcript_58860/g.137037 Transcript_58860/m.137037 type:complete len:305 (-) Transcript_58860:122-1036(-)|eukprot:CAMPEP_0171069018 /NCGR_PEP_ID=MMETSP0766_2-20121228/8901_1 /TAXON_ID=439317 /ORGANISM="Gambierdiscus australes, Strain CAWD 149" /LENGTH=304 /DNA_ID=CAMNT_0011525371 /DNA_START=48 /DNA_END=962 /DNA_ORIENTATION=+
MAHELTRRGSHDAQSKGWDSASPELQEKLARRLQRIGEQGSPSKASASGASEAEERSPGGAANSRTKEGEERSPGEAQFPSADPSSSSSRCHVTVAGKPPEGEPAHGQAQPQSRQSGHHTDPSEPLRERSASGKEQDQEGSASRASSAHQRRPCCGLRWYLALLAVSFTVVFVLSGDERWAPSAWTTAAESTAELRVTLAEQLASCQNPSLGEGIVMLSATSQSLDAIGMDGRLHCGKVLARARTEHLRLLARVLISGLVSVVVLFLVVVVSCCIRTRSTAFGVVCVAALLAIPVIAAAVAPEA